MGPRFFSRETRNTGAGFRRIPHLSSNGSLDVARDGTHAVPVKYPLSCTVKITTLLAALLAAPNLFAQLLPQRVAGSSLGLAPYNSTGLLRAEINGRGFRGSAAVARDERLLYTCAHVFFNEGVWADDIRFDLAWHGAEGPGATEPGTAPVRGFRYHSGYAGGNSPEAFGKDFAIGYRNAQTSFGPVLPVARQGSSFLTDFSVGKLIVGYPAYFFNNGASGFYYQHRLGVTYYRMNQVRNTYHFVEGLTTGPGNSGGPVLAVTDTTYTLVGILVSGSRTGLGIYGLSKTAANIASITLLDLESVAAGGSTTKRGGNDNSVRLPDATKLYTARTVKVSGAGDIATAVKLNLRINTSFRGDLDVYVRSPSGRTHWMQRHSRAASGVNLDIKNTDVSSTFFGANPNGQWTFFMRDFYADDRATFKNASITVKSAES